MVENRIKELTPDKPKRVLLQIPFIENEHSFLAERADTLGYSRVDMARWSVNTVRSALDLLWDMKNRGKNLQDEDFMVVYLLVNGFMSFSERDRLLSKDVGVDSKSQ